MHEIYIIAFKVVAILHGLAGYVIMVFALSEDVQQSCFYKDRNPLAGDINKYLAYASCSSLMLCGAFAVFSFFEFPNAPKFSVITAWASVLFYHLTAWVFLVEKRHWPSSKISWIALGARIAAAAMLTGFFHEAGYVL
jgi:hypothetical protein